MEASLTGRPEDTDRYVEATSTPAFYQVMNGRRVDYDAYARGIAEWRGKISEYKPTV